MLLDALGMLEDAWKGKKWKHDRINTDESMSRILFFTLQFTLSI